MELFLNCVPLTVDPRSSKRNKKKRGGDDDEDEDQDDHGVRFDRRETAEFSFMAEREAVMNGASAEEDIGGEDSGGTLLRLVQRTAWNLNGAAGDPCAASACAISPRSFAASGLVAGGGAGGGLFESEEEEEEEEERRARAAMGMGSPFYEGETDVDVAIDAAVMAAGVPGRPPAEFVAGRREEPAGSSSAADQLNVPGGLWSLPSDEEGEASYEDETMGMMAMMSYATSADDDDDRGGQKEAAASAAAAAAWMVHEEGLHGAVEDGKLEALAASQGNDGYRRGVDAREENRQETLRDPAILAVQLAAQRAVGRAMNPISPSSNGSYDDKFWFAEEKREEGEAAGVRANDYGYQEADPQSYDDDAQMPSDALREDAYEINVDDIEVGTTEEDEDEAAPDEGAGEEEGVSGEYSKESKEEFDNGHYEEEDGDHGSYCPNPEDVPRFVPVMMQEQDQGQDNRPPPQQQEHPTKFSPQQQQQQQQRQWEPPIPPTMQRHDVNAKHWEQHPPYASNEEANEHFDRLMSAFELSLTRGGDKDDNVAPSPSRRERRDPPAAIDRGRRDDEEDGADARTGTGIGGDREEAPPTTPLSPGRKGRNKRRDSSRRRRALQMTEEAFAEEGSHESPQGSSSSSSNNNKKVAGGRSRATTGLSKDSFLGGTMGRKWIRTRGGAAATVPSLSSPAPSSVAPPSPAEDDEDDDDEAHASPVATNEDARQDDDDDDHGSVVSHGSLLRRAGRTVSRAAASSAGRRVTAAAAAARRDEANGRDDDDGSEGPRDEDVPGDETRNLLEAAEGDSANHRVDKFEFEERESREGEGQESRRREWAHEVEEDEDDDARNNEARLREDQMPNRDAGETETATTTVTATTRGDIDRSAAAPSLAQQRRRQRGFGKGDDRRAKHLARLRARTEEEEEEATEDCPDDERMRGVGVRPDAGVEEDAGEEEEIGASSARYDDDGGEGFNVARRFQGLDAFQSGIDDNKEDEKDETATSPTREFGRYKVDAARLVEGFNARLLGVFGIDNDKEQEEDVVASPAARDKGFDVARRFEGLDTFQSGIDDNKEDEKDETATSPTREFDGRYKVDAARLVEGFNARLLFGIANKEQEEDAVASPAARDDHDGEGAGTAHLFESGIGASAEAGNSSTDSSSINWDVLAYSMSDTVSIYGASRDVRVGEDAADADAADADGPADTPRKSPVFTSEADDSVDEEGGNEDDVRIPPVKRWSAGGSPGVSRTAVADAFGEDGNDDDMRIPSVKRWLAGAPSEVSAVADEGSRRTDVASSPKEEGADYAPDAAELTPRPWEDRIDQIKWKHDEKLNEIRSPSGTPKQEGYKQAAFGAKSMYENVTPRHHFMVANPSDEENVPLSPNSPLNAGASSQADQRRAIVNQQRNEDSWQAEKGLSSPVSSPYTHETLSSRSRYESMASHLHIAIANSSDEENTPLSLNSPPDSGTPYQMNQRLETLKKQHRQMEMKFSSLTSSPFKPTSALGPESRYENMTSHHQIRTSNSSDAENVPLSPNAPPNTGTSCQTKQSLDILKKQHEKDLWRMKMELSSPKSSQYKTTTLSPMSRYEDTASYRHVTIANSSDEESAPLSLHSPPNSGTSYQMNQRLEVLKKQHEKDIRQMEMELSSPISSPGHYDLSTPRLLGKASQMETKVQSRIDAMRDQHKKNMDKMRHALEDMKPDRSNGQEENHNRADHSKNYWERAVSAISPVHLPDADHPLSPSADPVSTKNEKHLAESVGLWKHNAKRFEKARDQYNSWKTVTDIASPPHTPSQTPKNHQERRNRYFNFDEATLGTPVTEKHPSVASPRMQKLLMKNEELEEEMRQIRLLSPTKAKSSAAATPKSLAILGGKSPASVSVKKDSLELHSEALDGIAKSVERIDVAPGSTHHIRLDTASHKMFLHSSEDSISRRRHNFQTAVSDTANTKEMPMNTRISGLIADVKQFLDKETGVQDRLSEDILYFSPKLETSV